MINKKYITTGILTALLFTTPASIFQLNQHSNDNTAHAASSHKANSFRLTIDGKRQNIKKTDFKFVKVKNHYEATVYNKKFKAGQKCNVLFNLNLMQKEKHRIIYVEPIVKKNKLIIKTRDKNVMRYIIEFYIKN